jgi:hypothetical protein
MRGKRARRRGALASRILQLEHSLRHLTERVLELEKMTASASTSPIPSSTIANRLVDQIALGLSLSRKTDPVEHPLVPSELIDGVSNRSRDLT